MRALTLLLATLLVLSPWIPLAVAVNPTDDDAGSGQDAGDDEALAIPIEPGVHEGQLRSPIDGQDWYAIDVEKGQQLTFAIEDWESQWFAYLRGPGGTPSFTFPPGPISLVVPETGTWTIGFADDVRNMQPNPYQFRVEVEDPATVLNEAPFPGGTVVEAAWDEMTDVALNVISCARDGPGLRSEISGQMLQLNLTSGDQNLRWIGGGYSDSPGTGSSLLVEGPRSVHVDAPAPVGREGEECGGYRFTGDTETGRIRAVLWATDEDTRSFLTFGANRSLETRTYTTHEFIGWGGEDEDALRLRAPGVNVADDRSTERELPESFFGVFETYEAGGWAQRPDGSRIPIEDGGSGFFLVSPPAGEWRFHVDRSASLVQAERPYLQGIRAPDLGLTDHLSFTTTPHTCRGVECLLTLSP